MFWFHFNLELMLPFTISGVEIAEFEGYELGLKATKDFAEGSLILTIPSKVMMTEKNARESTLSEFIAIDPLLQNMPNITLALFLLIEKNNPGKLRRVNTFTILGKTGYSGARRSSVGCPTRWTNDISGHRRLMDETGGSRPLVVAFVGGRSMSSSQILPS